MTVCLSTRHTDTYMNRNELELFRKKNMNFLSVLRTEINYVDAKIYKLKYI